MAQDAAQHVHHDAFRDFSFATRHRPQRLHYLPFNQLLTRSATDNYQAWLEHLYPFAPGEDYPFPEGQTQEEQLLAFKRLKDQVLRWGASDPNFKNGRVAQWVQEAWDRLKKAAEDGSDLMLLEVIGTYPMLPKPDWGKQETALEINTKTLNHKAESDIARRALLYKLFMEPPYTLKNSQSKRYADIPYSELLKRGQTGIMLGIYELAHGCVPDFQSLEEERDFLLQEQKRVIKGEGAIEGICWIHSDDYSYLIPEMDAWIKDARQRLETEATRDYRLTLSEVVRSDDPAARLMPCLEGLWISVCQQPLSLSSHSVAEGENRQQSATLSPTEEVEECPFDLDELTTSEQKKRVLFVWKNRPTYPQIRSEFTLSRSAWGKFKDNVNGRLTTCQLLFNKNDFRYELVGIKDQ